MRDEGLIIAGMGNIWPAKPITDFSKAISFFSSQLKFILTILILRGKQGMPITGKTGHIRARARQCHEIARVRSMALVRHFCFLQVSCEHEVKRTHTGWVMLLKTVIIVLVVM